ncbi:hypothetical protein [Pelosinus sp. IPA-1]|uniref:hypothetical protein n=1 Tax=Pelosinus sp. IPA-1 TaxID=3029569 RepID=UPI00243620D6|nr:hypothetical protein [Pelosinus sp. IPA-1]GMA99322.1 hypothetical protein PIPA1_21220 [Pelosinus sp. IPA-1]
MKITDQVKVYTRTLVQSVIDKEPVNYMEAAGLFGIILQARHNISMLSSLYNQAQDPELKELIKKAIYEETIPAIETCEELMRDGDGELPDVHFAPHPLYDNVDYPKDVRLTDMEIAIAIGNIARAFQLVLFLTLQQCYQLEIIFGINKLLNSGLLWGYHLVQLMLHRGWLPRVSKVEH